jgi:hypothetical protein
MPVTLKDTPSKNAKPNPFNNLNDEEFGEEIVALFIAYANAERHAAGLPDLSVGSLCNALEN